MNEPENSNPNRKTVWEKIDYLMECIDDLDIYHIRYCELATCHLIINDKHKWANLVHDPGTVVSEMSFEEVKYQNTVELFGKHLKELE